MRGRRRERGKNRECVRETLRGRRREKEKQRMGEKEVDGER